MRTLRIWLRNLLIWLPGSVGESVLLPRVRSIYDRLPLLDWRTQRYVRNEARRVKSAISSGVRQFTVVYDTEVVGLAYGTVVNFVAIVKYLNAHNVNTKLYFVNVSAGNLEPSVVGFQEDYEFDQAEIDYFLTESIKFAKAALQENLTDIRLISGDELIANVNQCSKEYILFEDFTKNRRPFFRDCFNLFNQLMATSDILTQNRILFSSTDFIEYLPDQFRGKSYVTWACRYSAKGADFGRQTMENEFCKIYSYLRDRFPSYDIVLVSDESGCAHYSTLAKNNGILDLKYSKTYFTDFVGDSALVANSQYFFCFRAGGIASVAVLSNLPYEMFLPLMNEIPWDKNKLTVWQKETQTYVILNKHQFEQHRDRDLDKLGVQRRRDGGGIG